MIKFIGSVYFALILIASVAIVAVTGTFLESYSSSHLFAARLTYGSPFFGALLWLFFLNILVATLLRWPFRKSHIPFIITHLGLLMLLGGQLVKHYSGIQGTILLSEGCSTCEYFDDKSTALQLTARDGTVHRYQIHDMKIDHPDVAVTSFHPNGTEEIRGWIHKNALHISGLDPIPVKEWSPSKPIPKPTVARLHHAQSSPWSIFAIKTDNVDALIDAFKPFQPFVVFLDNNPQEALWVSQGGELRRTEIDPKDSVAMYDNGFGGYTTATEVPFSNLPDTAEHHRQALLHALTIQLRLQHNSPDQLTPPLKLLYQATEKSDVPFVETTIAFLDEWDRSGDYLFLGKMESPDLKSAIEALDKTDMLALIHNAAPEIEPHTTQLSSAGLFSICCKAYGLELQKMMPPDREQLLQEYFAACLFCNVVDHTLPKLSKWPLDEKVAFLLAFPLDAEQLVGLRKAYVEYLKASIPNIQLPEGYTPSLKEIVEAIRVLTPLSHPLYTPVAEDFVYSATKIESPIFPIRNGAAETVKLEEHRPIATFELKGEFNDKFTLLFDPYGTGLQWPVAKGNLLARFQPDFKTLPFKLKLIQARQINYANTSQPYSFEADLRIGEENTPITLSMNQVHEMPDGSRLYLSGISPTELGAWKRVQIVVNRDPGKYWLTYPGALILILGASLLFFFRRKTT